MEALFVRDKWAIVNTEFQVVADARQQNHWGQSHWERSHAHPQPRHHRLKDGGRQFTGERQLTRGAVPPI